jgi:hypothetical protein
MQQMTTENQLSYKTLQQNFASSSKLISSSTNKIISEVCHSHDNPFYLGLTMIPQHTEWYNSTNGYVTKASAHLGGLRQTTQALFEDGTHEDLPTGSTPQKRRWDYTDSWPRTKARDILLRERSAGSLFTSPPTSALPEEEQEDDALMDDLTPVLLEEVLEPELEPESMAPISPTIDAPPPPPYEHVESKIETKVEAKAAHSRTSSTTSNSASTAPTRTSSLASTKRGISGLPKSTVQQQALLTERSTNVLTNRRRLR